MRLQPPFREPTTDRIVSSDPRRVLQAQRKVAEIPAAHRLHTVKTSTHYGVSMPARQPVTQTARTFNEHGRLRRALVPDSSVLYTPEPMLTALEVLVLVFMVNCGFSGLQLHGGVCFHNLHPAESFQKLLLGLLCFRMFLSALAIHLAAAVGQKSTILPWAGLTFVFGFGAFVHIGWMWWKRNDNTSPGRHLAPKRGISWGP